MNKKDYLDYVSERSKKSRCLLNSVKAFFVGGLICTLGQAFSDLYAGLGAEKSIASALASVSLIFLAGLLTGIGWFDVLAKFAGAGTLVPITGFANAVCSIAIESRRLCDGRMRGHVQNRRPGDRVRHLALGHLRRNLLFLHLSGKREKDNYGHTSISGLLHFAHGLDGRKDRGGGTARRLL